MIYRKSNAKMQHLIPDLIEGVLYIFLEQENLDHILDNIISLILNFDGVIMRLYYTGKCPYS